MRGNEGRHREGKPSSHKAEEKINETGEVLKGKGNQKSSKVAAVRTVKGRSASGSEESLPPVRETPKCRTDRGSSQ